jgi:hypothetical protein
MTDPVNQKYGITDEAIDAEVARLLPAMQAWGEEDACTHPFTPLAGAEIAKRKERDVQGKASAAIEGIYPTVEDEAMNEVFDRLRWDGAKRRRYITSLFPAA